MVEGILETTDQTPAAPTAKKALKNRYFIELHVPENKEVPRVLMDEIRRHSALEFIQVLREWVKELGMDEEISSLTTTAMGQVMIVCSHKMIDFIREQDVWAIAHIRSGSQAGDLRSISGKV